MPIPVILWGAAALLGAVGIAKGVEASNNIDKAKSIGESAENRHQKALSGLESDRNDTQHALTELGVLKVHVFTNQIRHLIDVIKKSKAARSKLTGFQENFTVDEIRNYERLVQNSMEIEKSIGSGVAGGALAAIGAYGAVSTLATASTGAAISGLSGVAATNATLAWLGGGALSAGGFGIAGGMMALGGIVLGPALAIGGFIMASQAEEALTKAERYSAEVDEAVAKIKIARLALKGIRTTAAEYAAIIAELVKRFEQIKVHDASDTAAFERMLVIGKGLKDVLNVSILDADGNAVPNIRAKCDGLLEIC